MDSDKVSFTFVLSWSITIEGTKLDHDKMVIVVTSVGIIGPVNVWRERETKARVQNIIIKLFKRNNWQRTPAKLEAQALP
jgi:hypothetical protein